MRLRIADFARIKRSGRNISPAARRSRLDPPVLSAENPVAPRFEADDVAGPELPLPRRVDFNRGFCNAGWSPPGQSAISARWTGPNDRMCRTAPCNAPLPAGTICMSWRRTNNFDAPEATPAAAIFNALPPNRTEPSLTSTGSTIDLPMKPKTNGVAGSRRPRRACRLLDPALVHHHHAVGDFQRLFLVVGDEDRGQADPSCSRRSQRRSSLRTLASSAPNGSSSSSTRGSIASARARATRWRWPPDSWLG